MGKPIWIGLVSAIIVASVCGGIYALTERGDVAQATPSIEHSGVAQAPLSEVETVVGVDANPAGNTATSLGTINGCISVNFDPPPADTFSIDLVVQDVTNLHKWDGTFRFDESVVQVNSLTTNGFFLGSNTYGPVFQCYPDPDGDEGECTFGTHDMTGAGHSGSGVLGRLELTAIGPGPGISKISKANFDLRPDGYPTSGVQLLDPGGNPVGPVDQYGYFDGTILNAQIAVDEPCPGECLPDVDTDTDGFDDDVECYLPTDPLDACPDVLYIDDAWPLDVNMDTFVTVGGDVLPFRGRIGATGGPPPSANWLQRLDLNADNFITVGGDVLGFRGRIGQTCS